MRKVTYTTASGDAASGTTFDLSSARAIGWGNDLLGWSWDADKDTGAITRAARTYEMEIVAIDVSAFDELSRRMEQDAVAGRMGTLSVDGWELSCAAKTAAPKHVGDGIVSAKLTLYATDPTWRRITSHALVPESGTQTETTGLDYPTDYGYDYAGTTRSSGIESFSLAVESSIRVIFWGPCTNPYCTVTSRSNATSVSNRFGVNASAETGERISARAYAREPESKPKMDSSQTTGSASSYAGKRALGNLFAIDDTADADQIEQGKQAPKEGPFDAKCSACGAVWSLTKEQFESFTCPQCGNKHAKVL